MLAELERRQDAILARLGQLKAEVEKLGGGALSSVSATTQCAVTGQQEPLVNTSLMLPIPTTK